MEIIPQLSNQPETSSPLASHFTWLVLYEAIPVAQTISWLSRVSNRYFALDGSRCAVVSPQVRHHALGSGFEPQMGIFDLVVGRSPIFVFILSSILWYYRV